MSVELYSPLLTQNNSWLNFSSETAFPVVCTFQQIKSMEDMLKLFKNKSCRRYSSEYTVFLCLANFSILLFGLIGNLLVVYVVACKLKTRTESSIYILNLAIADLLVIFCCIPATFVANLFMPWVFGDAMCKIVAYGQGASVFCSVYSLVAISYDRFRAVNQSVDESQHVFNKRAVHWVCFIWFLGLLFTFPWAFMFKVVSVNPYIYGATSNTKPHIGTELPFCLETWDSQTAEAAYFLLVHIIACFVVPLGIIIACNVQIWQNVLSTHFSNGSASPLSSSWCLRESQRRRKLRMLKMFTGLTLVFFICWMPLYVIMARVKFSYTVSKRGTRFEQDLVHALIPVAQLLASCNSCVNPVLYALLNQNFRYIFRQMFFRSANTQSRTNIATAVKYSNKNSKAVVVAEDLNLE